MKSQQEGNVSVRNNNNSGVMPQADDSSSDALADALSSSLANIAAHRSSTSHHHHSHRNQNSSGGDGLLLSNQNKIGATSADDTRSSNSSEEGETGGQSSSSSNGRVTGGGSTGGEEGALVTASNTTGSSGGDDRDSSTGGRGNASGEASKDSSSDSGPNHSDQHHHHHHHPRHHHSNHPQVLSSHPSSNSTRQQRKHMNESHVNNNSESKTTAGSLAVADGYGLPVPRDDQHRLNRTPSSQHATVVAHLPPPQSSMTGGSGGESSSSSSAMEDQHRYELGSLLQPHREPGLHTIRRTFNRLRRASTTAAAASAANKSCSETDSSGGGGDNSNNRLLTAAHLHHHKYKAVNKRSNKYPADLMKESKKRKLPSASSDRGSDNDESGGNGSSSGSGTEGGYAGSASSNERVAQSGSCSSPSVSSSEESIGRHKRVKVKPSSSTTHASGTVRPLLRQKQESTLSMSSEIADFSSGSSENSDSHGFAAAFAPSPSRSPSISSSDDQDDAFLDQALLHKVHHAAAARKRHAPGWPPRHLQMTDSQSVQQQQPLSTATLTLKPRGNLKCEFAAWHGKPPILAVGCDIMAHVLTFLEPPDILDVLTMPLSKDWLNNFTRQPELWRVLCLVDPFKAQVEQPGETSGSGESSSSDDSIDSYSVDVEVELRKAFGKFRLLYTSFVRCLRYLSRIKEDALHGRPPSVIDYGARQLAGHNICTNQNLHQFLARARGVVVRNRAQEDADAAAAALDNSDISDDDNSSPVAGDASPKVAIGVSDDGSSTSVPHNSKKCNEVADEAPPCKKKKRVKYGHSILTQRLLGPAADGTTGNHELPWSCAIYSIVNWMVAFSDVEGIQTMCLKVLPFILEDEQQRMTAQRAGLTDIVLRGMVMFPDSTALHTAAFHTIVLLARPLGGREGMLFHSSMVNSSGIFSAENGSSDGRNGIAVMLDSMRRFQHHEVLQAMSCWSLVNIALAPSQKEMLVKLGGIEVTANAMTTHPYSAEVQFRALFALINLVIPSVNVNEHAEEGDADAVVPVEDSSEKEMLEEMVDQLVNLVVLAMKNFCASEAILNRACLVLHNLSLTQEFHEPLILTPNCYQMLEWCLANYPTDQVLQQSAAGTLHRLQITLSSDETLRGRFAAALQLQQRESLEQAHQEAIVFHEQQEQQRLTQDLNAEAS